MVLLGLGACTSSSSGLTSEKSGEPTTASTDNLQAVTHADVETSVWSVIAGPDERISGVAMSQDWVALTIADANGEQVIATSRHGEANRYHSPDRGWLIQSVAFTTDRVLAVDANGASGEVRIVELSDQGQAVNVLWRSSYFDPGLVAVGDTFFHLQMSEDGLFCITRLGAASNSFCNADGTISRLAVVDGSLVSFVQFPVDQPNQQAACGSIYVLDLVASDPPVSTEALSSGCVLAGQANGAVSAWSEVPEPDQTGRVNYQAVQIGAHDGSEFVELGLGLAGSVTLCGDEVLWTHSSGANPSEIRSWRPGGEVNTIYVSPDEGDGFRYATTRPFCSNNETVYIQRAGWQAGAPDEVLVRGLSEELFVEVPAFVSRATLSVRESFTQFEGLQSWVATKGDTDIELFVSQFCHELTEEPAETVVQLLWSDLAAERWMVDFELADSTELYWFRQAATQAGCPAQHSLTLGD